MTPPTGQSLSNWAKKSGVIFRDKLESNIYQTVSTHWKLTLMLNYLVIPKIFKHSYRVFTADKITNDLNQLKLNEFIKTDL